MTVLNYKEYDLIRTWARPEGEYPRIGPENSIQKKQPTGGVNWIDDLHSDNELYFYIEFFHADAFYWFPLETLVPPDILWKIKQGKVTLVLCNTAHGYHRNVDLIYRHVLIRFNLDPNSVLLRTESADIYEEVEIIAKKYNLKPIRVDWVTEFEFVHKNFILRKPYENFKTLEFKTYDKKFLAYNGFNRPHRTMLMYLLQSMDLLDKGYVSYNVKSDVNGLYAYNLMLSSLGYNQEIKNVLEHNKADFIKLTKLTLDSDENDTRYLSMIHDSQAEHFNNTYFSVVTETSFTNEVFYPNSTDNTEVGRILSEKIFRTIMLKHPIIILSNLRVLELLHYLGYKTFSPIIDESYDLIEDPAERILAVAKEIQRLSNLNEEELRDFIIKAREITEYNFKVLKEKTEFAKRLPLKQ